MKTRRLSGPALGLGVALAVGQFVAAGKPPGAAQPPTATGKGGAAAVKGQRAEAFVAAFDKGDAKALAGFWTPDGDYVDQVGRDYKGRAAIEKLYEGVFAGKKGGKLTVTVTNARMVGADTAIEDGVTEVTPADGSPGTAARFTAVLVKQGGQWYFESVRESVAHPPSNAAHFDGISWLIGNWAGEAEKGESGTASYSWAENRNFIVSAFATTVNGVPVAGGTQWIAWDAIDKQIRSWSFYSGGGVGEAAWKKDGDKWVTAVTARTADGKKVTGTNTLTRVDADRLVWQLTKMVVEGQPVPDPQPLKLKRVKP
jgi:uncharacterized protein (TIGR02246 family)